MEVAEATGSGAARLKRGSGGDLKIIENWDLRCRCLSVIISPRDADVAQLVEHDLAKVGVAGSNPVVRSIACWKAGHTEEVLAGLFSTAA